MSTGNSKTPAPPAGTEVLNDVERSGLEKRVLDHFRRNSRAMDSAEGVARFWVGENHHVVEHCLIDLHHRGLLQKRTIAGTDLYSLEKDRELTKAESGRPDAEPRRLSMENSLLVDTLQMRNLELSETVARLAAVNEIGKATTGLLNLQELYDSLVRMVAQHLKARRVSILVTKPDSEDMSVVASIGITEHEVLSQPVRVGEGIAGRVAASQSALLVANIENSDVKELRSGGRYASPSFVSTSFSVSFPMRYQRNYVGVINASDKHSGDPFDEQDLEFLSTLSSQVAAAIEHARVVEDMEEGYLAVLVTLIQTVESSRPETRGHSRRVAGITTVVATAMELPAERIRLLQRAAALYNVGQLASAHEGRAGGDHAALAVERILARIASLRDVREILLRATGLLDSAGDVFGVAGTGIPLESRILAITEEFVRRTAGNERDPKASRRALDAIRHQAGCRHDTDVVDVLGDLLERGEVR